MAHTRYSKCWITKQNLNQSCIYDYDLHIFYLNIVGKVRKKKFISIFILSYIWSFKKAENNSNHQDCKIFRGIFYLPWLILLNKKQEFRISSARYDFLEMPRGFWYILLMCSLRLCHDQNLYMFYKVKPICCRTCFCLW